MGTRSADSGGSAALVVGEGPNFALGRKNATKTAAYTTAGESVIFADPSGGAFTITLATADLVAGHVVEIVNTTTSTNAITIATEGAETINGGNTITGNNATREAIRCWTDGTNWFGAQLPIPS